MKPTDDTIALTAFLSGRSSEGGHGQHGEWWWRNEVPSDALAEHLACPAQLQEKGS